MCLDAKSHVAFASPEDEQDWAQYNPQEDFERGGDVELARVIGQYLTRGLRSQVWDEFFFASQGQARLYEHFRALRERPYSAATAISMSAIYVYWRVEQELLDPTLRKHLDRWQGDEIRGYLEEILDSFLLQGAEEEAVKQDLTKFYNKLHGEVCRRLQETPVR